MTDTREQLLALAERVEKATGPDRALDIAIEKLLPCSHKFAENTPPHVHTLYNENAARFYGSRIGENDSDGDYHAARYTASLDAAMTLVDDRDLMAVLRGMLAALACDGITRKDLPRLICAATLRAKASQ